eukprot:SAG22_NODE_84_length_21617_cov_48.600102_3_plen_441_part_00
MKSVPTLNPLPIGHDHPRTILGLGMMRRKWNWKRGCFKTLCASGSCLPPATNTPACPPARLDCLLADRRCLLGRLQADADRAPTRVGWNRRIGDDMNDYFVSSYDPTDRQGPHEFTHVQGLNEPYPRPVWYQLRNDLFNGNEKESFPGELQLSVGVGDTKHAAQRLMPKDIWSTPPDAVAVKKNGHADWSLYKVNLNVYQAKDVVASDDNGLCDAYIVCYLEDRKPESTDIITKSRFPSWNQRVTFCQADPGNTEQVLLLPAMHWLKAGWGGRLTLMVYDSDHPNLPATENSHRIAPESLTRAGADEDDDQVEGDFLGRLSFSIEDVIEDDEKYGQPDWYPLQRTSLEDGEVWVEKKVGPPFPEQKVVGNGHVLLSCSIKEVPTGRGGRGRTNGAKRCDPYQKLSEYVFEMLDDDGSSDTGKGIGTATTPTVEPRAPGSD